MLKIALGLVYMLFLSTGLIGMERLESILPTFEKQIQKGMQENHVPGLIVAIIQDNQVVYIKGFGVRKEGEKAPITPETIFQIASISKPVTSSVIAALVGEGVVAWNSKVQDLDPAFQLSDAWITSEVTLEDLLSHRSGLPDHAGDLLEDLGFNQSTILHQLRFEPLSHFRAEFEYTNFGFSEAAYAAAMAAGLSWDEVVVRKLIDPLSMTSSTTQNADFIKQANRAHLHVIRDGSAKPLYNRNPDAQTPAGGFSTCMKDFTKWMTLILSDGVYDGKQVISSEALKQTYLPRITRGENRFYGLGWNLTYNAQGNAVLSHTGAFDLGTETTVDLIPNEKFGIAVFTNASPTGTGEALVDIFKELQETGKLKNDWFSIWRDRLHVLIPDPITAFPKPEFFSPPLAFQAYIGTYENEYYGPITIQQQEGKLYLLAGPKPKKFLLSHLNRDSFSFETRGESGTGLTQLIFTVGNSGAADQLVIEAFNKNGLGTFVRKQ